MSHDSPVESPDSNLSSDQSADSQSAESQSAESQSANSGNEIPAKRWWRSIIQMRLWMLLLLFIPAGYFAKTYVPEFQVSYYEEKEDLWIDAMQEIDFATLPNGTPTGRNLNVDKAFQSIGVSFAFGTPDREPGTDFENGAVNATFVGKGKSANLEPTNSQPIPGYKVPVGSPVIPSFLRPSAKGNSKTGKNAAAKNGAVTLAKTKGSGHIGISGYPFRTKFAFYPSTITCFEIGGSYTKRFKGSMTIRFHQPGTPEKQAGVYRVGFYAGRLAHAEALRVSLYSLDGELICRQANIQNRPFAFMGFRSNRKISRIEIETIGLDGDYAISGLMFDKVDLGIQGLAEVE